MSQMSTAKDQANGKPPSLLMKDSEKQQTKNFNTHLCDQNSVMSRATSIIKNKKVKRKIRKEKKKKADILPEGSPM